MRYHERTQFTRRPRTHATLRRLSAPARYALVLVLACFSLLLNSPQRAAAVGYPMFLPFTIGETWYVCQGYNGTVSVHQGVPALDLSIDPASVGPNGCTPATANSSTGKAVLAPDDGTLYHVGTDMVCLNSDWGGSSLIGHISGRPANGTSVSHGQQIGTVSPPDANSANGGYAHIHIQAYAGAGCGSSTPIAFDDAHQARFYCGPNLPYDGTVNQYRGLALTRCDAKWGTWIHRGGGLSAAPSAIDISGYVHVFARGLDNAVWYQVTDGGLNGWGSWSYLGGSIVGSPAAAAYNGRAFVFARGQDNAIWFRAEGGGASWGGWQHLGGAVSDSPTAVAYQGKLYVFVRGQDNAVWYRTFDGTTWTGWAWLGGGTNAAPSATVYRGKLYLVLRGLDNAVWYRTLTGNTWDSWGWLGGSLSAGPAAVAGTYWPLYVFARGTDNAVWFRVFNGSTWTSWLYYSSGIAGTPTGVVDSNSYKLHVFARGTDNGLWQRHILAGP